MSTVANLEGLNVTPGSPTSIPINAGSSITVNALPGTDLWRKPPSTNSVNAPAYVVYRPLNQFKRARVTITAEWTRLYDHGGLVFHINSPGEKYQSWIKTGIEMFDGEPHVGTVATPLGGYADLSLFPATGKSVTIEVVAKKPSLEVYLIEREKRMLIRQVTWVFQENQELVLGVGIFAARPTKLEGEEIGKGEALAVSFEGLEIEWSD
ncbi:unnamed protein product [Rhizoctonia solani]|uniref:Uncharacterized protein n=1 Tax=Rhizoctonia solani TaxID=456999 RepID=A0A8H3C0U5_9AGAM|nr:unnamed protein product [Rhizoctonia solani]